MERRLSHVLISAAVSALIYAPPAHAQWAVFDGTNFAESIKQTVEDIKQTTLIGQALVTAQQTWEAIGPAVSLALSANQWFHQGKELLTCIIPNPGMWFSGLEFNLTSICTAQDKMRAELGIPTTNDINATLNYAKDQISGGINGPSKADPLSPETWDNPFNPGSAQSKAVPSAQRNIVSAKRTAVATGTAYSALATGMASASNVPQTQTQALTIIANTAASPSVQEKIAQTNFALASVVQELGQIRALLAAQVQMQAAAELRHAPIAYVGMPPTKPFLTK